MQTRIEIKDFHLTADSLILEGISHNIQYENVLASGQMLVDSDQKAFIYKLEDETQYIYVSLPVKIWPSLKEVIEKNHSVRLKLEDKEIELVHIIDELQYLIHNIEGNSNYGDEMVKEVEGIFLNSM